MKRLLAAVVCCLSLGCGVAPVGDGSADGGDAGSGVGSGGNTGGSGGSGGAGGASSGVDLPCDVVDVLKSCTVCHGTPLSGSAPFRIATRADLMAPAPGFMGSTVAARSVARMADAQAPMPPGGSSSSDRAVLETWISAGMPAGSCSVDAGPIPTTCASNSLWTFGNAGSPNMNPGKPCVACHKVQEPFRAYYFMGTVFPSAHEKDSCNSRPPTSVFIDIIGADGGVLTLSSISPSGNFYSTSRSAQVGLPYTARVRDVLGRTRTMVTPQTNGDCNECHSEQGDQGAPGRIMWPN